MSLREVQGMFNALTLMQQVSYFPVASGGLFLYDYLLTIRDEVDLVWQASWSLGKILFLLARYPVFLDISMSIYHNIAPSIKPQTCTLVYNVSGGAFMFGIIIAESIMAIRIWALWGNSKIIGGFLGVCTVAMAAIGAFFYGRFPSYVIIDTDSIAPNLTGCLRGPGSRVLYVGYLGLAAYEALLLGLLLMKGVRDLRHISTGFLYTFYQDGIVYYVILLLISVLNAVTLLTGPPEVATLLISPQLTLHSVLSTRMLLRLRKSAGNRPHRADTSIPVDINILASSLPSPVSVSPSPSRKRRNRNSEMGAWFQGDVAGFGV